MACDSCWASNSLQTTSANKIIRLSSGALLGSAGDGDDREIVAMLDRIRSPEKLPSRAVLAATKCDFAGIIVFRTGQVWLITIGKEGTSHDFDAQVWPANRGIAAAGSGDELAIGAMAAGAAAREAVTIACNWDINSRGPVHVVQLKATKK